MFFWKISEHHRFPAGMRLLRQNSVKLAWNWLTTGSNSTITRPLLAQTRSELCQAPSELRQAPSELRQAPSSSVRTLPNFAVTSSQLAQTRPLLAQTRSELRQNSVRTPSKLSQNSVRTPSSSISFAQTFISQVDMFLLGHGYYHWLLLNSIVKDSSIFYE